MQRIHIYKFTRAFYQCLGRVRVLRGTLVYLELYNNMFLVLRYGSHIYFIFTGCPLDVWSPGDMSDCPLASIRCFNILLRHSLYVPSRRYS